jgi:glycine/D-amino acid oxidase-like deaminating enzyme
MSRKKPRNTSARAAKMRRQAKGIAARRGQQARTDLNTVLNAFTQAVAAGSLDLAAPDGTLYTAPIEQILRHINAELTEDREPAADAAEVAQLLAEDILIGALWLRPDGVWQSAVDYWTAQGETA